MKKIKLYLLILISIFCININVFAESTSATKTDNGIYDNETKYNELKKYFDNGIKTQNVSKSEIVTIYGKSVCDASGCNHEYIGGNTDFKTVLTKSVKCTNGEKYIIYQLASSGKADTFKATDGSELIGDAYWSEEYLVTCTNESGNNTISSNTSTGSNNTNTNSNNGTSNNTNTNNGTSNNTSQNNGYNTSTTTPNPEQGVETYYIILVAVAVISYFVVFMIKKHNLFKKV